MTTAVSVSRLAWTEAFPWKPSDLPAGDAPAGREAAHAFPMSRPLAAAPVSTSPEEAVRSLQAAYRNRDLEAAVECQDFRSEAILRFWRQGIAFDEVVLESKARSLEISFRQATVEKWPDFDGVNSTITSVEPMFGEFYLAVEAGSVGRSAYARTLYLSCVGGRWSVLGAMHRPNTYTA